MTALWVCRCGHDESEHIEVTDTWMNEFLACGVEDCECEDFDRAGESGGGA